jgi:glycosyltransferase 2 family protein
MSRPKDPRRTFLVNGALMLTSFALLGLAIGSNRGQIREIVAQALGRSPAGPVDFAMGLGLTFARPLFAAGFALYLVALVVTFLRWYVLVRALGLPFRVRDALRLGFIGNLFNLVIPGAVGGDLIKAAYLCREQSRKTQAVASMVIDRILGLIGLFLLAGVTGLGAWSGAGPDVRVLIAAAWAASALGLLGLAVGFTPALYRPLARLVAGRGKLETVLNELVTTASTYRDRLGTVAGCLALAMSSHALFVLSFYAASRALPFGSLPTLAQHYVIVPLILFSTAVPLPFGALGLTEQVSDQLFQFVHHPQGALAMMAYRVLMYGGGLVCAGVYVANLRQVRTPAGLAEPLAAEPLAPGCGRDAA